MNIDEEQKAVCARYGVEPVAASPSKKVGIAWNVRDGLQPVNGLRLSPEGDTSGWYIWAGDEWPDDPNSFVPLHIAHLDTWFPSILYYLQLPPGWRFQIAPGHEDVWWDSQLLEDSQENMI